MRNRESEAVPDLPLDTSSLPGIFRFRAILDRCESVCLAFKLQESNDLVAPQRFLELSLSITRVEAQLLPPSAAFPPC